MNKSSNKKTIHKVRRIRKMFGGTMRQSGILAGGAMYALDHQLKRLEADHANAQLLAGGLQEIEGISCNPNLTETNLVFFNIDECLGAGDEFCRRLAERGVLAEALDAQRIRFVTHLGISKSDIEKTIQITANTCKYASP